MNQKLSDLNLVLKARWENPNKYRRKVVVTDHGCSYYSIGWDKTEEQLLSQIRQDYNLDENNKPKAKWYELWKK